jgi:hypothetical protein
MRDWHVKNMENTIVKYVRGLPDNATRYQKKMHRRYYRLERVCGRIKYDIRHGVKNEEVISFLNKIKIDPTFCDLPDSPNYLGRLNEIEAHFNDVGR